MPWISTNTSPGRSLPMLERWVRGLAGAGSAWVVVLASLALCAIGMYGIDLARALESTPGVWHPMAIKQLALVGIGIGAAVVVALPSYRLLGQLSWVLLALALCLLVFVLLPFVPTSIVRPRNGARGWIDLGPIELQPAEVAKVAYVLVLAWYMRYSKTHRTFLGLLPPAILTAIPVGLITLEPDLGTAGLFVPVLFSVLVAAGAKLRHLGIVVLVAALAAPMTYPMLKPHQKQRIVGLMQQIKGDTSGDQDINMQSLTAQRLVGSGQFDGVGDSKSRALVHFSRLPERHNDMILAVLANRFGLFGILVILGIYAAWIVAALGVAATIREPFARLVIVGFAAFIGAQVFVNIGMNLGIVPIIGVTLPFVSYGGSSMVTAWMMTGLVFGISIRRASMPTRRSFEYAEGEG